MGYEERGTALLPELPSQPLNSGIVVLTPLPAELPVFNAAPAQLIFGTATATLGLTAAAAT